MANSSPIYPQGHINYVFTTVVHYPAIQTLEDIIDQGITIYTSPGVKSLIEPPLNEYQEQILQRHIAIRTYEDPSGGMDEVLKQENTATLKRRSDVFVELLNFYTDEVGEPKFVVVQECFRCFFLSYISGKRNSSFIYLLKISVRKKIWQIKKMAKCVVLAHFRYIACA